MRAGLDFQHISLANGDADVLGYEVLQWNGKRIARIRLVARTVSSRCRVSGRAMELVNGHESFLALSDRGALSILDASFKFAQASYLVAGEPWSTVRMEQRAFGGILCLFRSDWGLRWLDVCICTDASEKGFAFVVREGCRKLASVVSSSRQASREASGPSVPGHVRFAPSRRESTWIIPVPTRMRCCSSEKSVVQTSLRRHCKFLDPSKWKLTAYGVSSARKTSEFLRHVPSCMPSGIRRVVVRRDSS